jgi:hypothetical protein
MTEFSNKVIEELKPIKDHRKIALVAGKIANTVRDSMSPSSKKLVDLVIKYGEGEDVSSEELKAAGDAAAYATNAAARAAASATYWATVYDAYWAAAAAEAAYWAADAAYWAYAAAYWAAAAAEAAHWAYEAAAEATHWAYEAATSAAYWASGEKRKAKQEQILQIIKEG